jgi:hypothetical protein
MTGRTTRKTVTFKRSFVLSNIAGIQPAGVYHVETDEESLDSRSMLGYRRVATFIEVNRDGGTQVFRIDPVELEVALLKDSSLTVSSLGDDR